MRELTNFEIAKITTPGTHCIGNNLYLQVVNPKKRYFLHRYQMRGQQRSSGLGPFPEVSPAVARAKRDKERAQIRDGIDPVAARQAERIAACINRVKTIAFQAYAESWVEIQKAGWRHPGTLQNVRGKL